MIPFQYRLLATILSAVLLAQACWATDESSEQNYFQEFPVVLSASRLKQPQSEAPNAMTVIGREMIVASGARSLPELFRLVPGMYVGYYKGNQPFVSYHGATDQYARRMQVMIDGRSVYLPPVSMVDWGDLPITLNDIERIEVVRGPAAASHGANSLQGVISIITKDAGMQDGKNISFTHGNKGINDVSAHFGERGDTFDYRMTVAYTTDNGYDNQTSLPPTLLNSIPRSGTTLNLLNNSNDSNRVRMMNFRANYHPDGVDSLDVQMGVNRDVQIVGWTDSTGNPVHDLIANSSFLQLDWNHVLDASSELRLRYYHLQHEQSEDFKLVSPPAPPVAAGLQVVQSNNTGRDEIEVQHTLQTGDTNRLVYGAGWRSDSVAASGYSLAMLLYKCPSGSAFRCPPSYSSFSASNEYRVFAHDEWRISPQLLLNMGAMFESDRMGQRRLSPRIAVNYHVTPAHTVRIGTSVAHRTPALIEEKFPSAPQPGTLFVPSPTVTSPGLVPERILSREIGYLGEFSDLNASLDIRLFRDTINDGIYVSSITGGFANGMNSLYQGLEATLKHSTENDDLTINWSYEKPSSNGPIMFAAGHTYFRSNSSWTNDVLIGSIPQNTASLLYTRRLSQGYSFSTSYSYQDKLQPFDRGPLDYQPRQSRVDIRLAKSFKLDKSMRGEVALVVQNLFDDKYTEFVANNLFNRRSYMTLSLGW